jgi:hypothetical protein
MRTVIYTCRSTPGCSVPGSGAACTRSACGTPSTRSTALGTPPSPPTRSSGPLAAHGFTLDREGEVEQLAEFVGPFSARAAQIGGNIDRYEADWLAANPGRQSGPALRPCLRARPIARTAAANTARPGRQPERARWPRHFAQQPHPGRRLVHSNSLSRAHPLRPGHRKVQSLLPSRTTHVEPRPRRHRRVPGRWHAPRRRPVPPNRLLSEPGLSAAGCRS